jgi:hypothetical protein
VLDSTADGRSGRDAQIERNAHDGADHRAQLRQRQSEQPRLEDDEQCS